MRRKRCDKCDIEPVNIQTKFKSEQFFIEDHCEIPSRKSSLGSAQIKDLYSAMDAEIIIMSNLLRPIFSKQSHIGNNSIENFKVDDFGIVTSFAKTLISREKLKKRQCGKCLSLQKVSKKDARVNFSA